MNKDTWHHMGFGADSWWHSIATFGLIYEGELIEVADTENFFENPQDERTAAFTSGHLIY